MKSDNKKTAAVKPEVKAEVKAEVKEPVKAAVVVKEEPAKETKTAETVKAEEKEVKAAKKPGRKRGVKKAAAEKKTPGRKPAAVKATIVFQSNGMEYEPEAIMKKVQKAAAKQTDKLKKVEAYVNIDENAVYYVVNGEAKDDYKIQL